MNKEERDGALLAWADSIKTTVHTDFSARDCIGDVRRVRTFKRRKIKKICVLIAAAGILLTMSVGAYARYSDYSKKLFRSPNYDQGLDKAEATGYAKSLYLYSESGGIRLAVTACVSDETRTVVQVEVTGDYERKNTIEMSGIELRDENGQPIPIFEVGSGEGTFGPKAPGRDLPQSTLIRFGWGPSRDCTVTLHVSKINGADGDWNVEIPLTASPSIKFTTDFYYEEGDFSIAISEITFAPTQTVIKYHVCGIDPMITSCRLSNETECVNRIHAESYYPKGGGNDCIVYFGSLDPTSDLTLDIFPYTGKQQSHTVVIPLDQLVPEGDDTYQLQ